MSDATDQIYRHFLDGEINHSWWATTAEAYNGDGSKRFTVRKFVPDSYQSGNISLVIGTRDYPQGTEYTTSTYTFASSSQYLSVRAAGKVRSLQFSGSSRVTLGAWKEDIIALGEF
jgi:hypothetical protein